MSNLNLDVKETLKSIRNIEEISKEIHESFNRINSSMENLGQTWRDSEYKKVENYVKKAETVINSYNKSTAEYLEEVVPRIKKLEQEYLEQGESLNDSILDDLDLGGLEVEEKEKDLIVGAVAEEPETEEPETEEPETVIKGYKLIRGYTDNGYAIVKKHDDYGILNDKEELINVIYCDELVPQENGGIKVSRNGIWVDMDETGKIIGG